MGRLSPRKPTLAGILWALLLCAPRRAQLVETQQVLVSSGQKLNFDLRSVRSEPEATYKFSSDIAELETNGFQAVDSLDIRAKFGIDFDYDSQDFSSFVVQEESVYFTLQGALYVLFVGTTKYAKVDACAQVHLSTDLIFCLGPAPERGAAPAAVEVTVLTNSPPFAKVGGYSLQLPAGGVKAVKAFDAFKNQDDGLVLAVILQKDPALRVGAASHDFTLVYCFLEREKEKLRLELDFPEAELLHSNFINDQIMFVSPKYLTTFRVGSDAKGASVSYVYSFYEDLLQHCSFDNSDATNMNLSCSTQTPGKVLSFSFLKSNFLINSFSQAALSLQPEGLLRTLIGYKYIFAVYATQITVFSKSNLEFHAQSQASLPSTAGLLLDSEAILDSISYVSGDGKLVSLQVFSFLRAACHAYTSGSYLQLDFQEPTSGASKQLRFELKEVPGEESFFVVYSQDSLPDISFNAKNLNYRIPANLVLGADLRPELLIGDAPPIPYNKMDTAYSFSFNTAFNPALSEYTQFLHFEDNGVPLFVLISQTNARLSLFSCRVAPLIRCRLTKEVALQKAEILRLSFFRTGVASTHSALVLISDRRVGIGRLDRLEELAWTELGSDLGLRDCTSPDRANVFCICERDNFVRKVMITAALRVSAVSIPEIELARSLYSTSSFKDLIFVQTIEGLTVFNFKLKKIKFELSNQVTANDKTFFVKISESFLVFISKDLNCFLFYGLEEFYQGNVPLPRFETCQPFPAGFKLSNFTINKRFHDSKMPLVLHNSDSNSLLLFDLARPQMDLLFFQRRVAPRNKLEIVNYQLHRSPSRPDTYYVTIANPSFSEQPLLAVRVDFSFSFQTDLPLGRASFDCQLRVSSGEGPAQSKSFSFRVARGLDTVDISTSSFVIDKMKNDQQTLDYATLFSRNALGFELQVDPLLSFNDFVNKYSLSPSLVYAHSFLQTLNMRDFALKSQVFLAAKSLLVILTRDSLMYFRYKEGSFSLLNIVSLLDFFALEQLECYFLSADSRADLHVLCDDSQAFRVVKFSLSNIFLPVSQTRLCESSRNAVRAFDPTEADQVVVFLDDSGANQSVFNAQSREDRSFFAVYDCASSRASPKTDLQQSFADFLGFHSLEGQTFFFFRQTSSFLPLTDHLVSAQGVNVYALDASSQRLVFQKTLSIGRPVARLHSIMLTPDKAFFLLVYASNQIEVAESKAFLADDFTVRTVPNYDNFAVQSCFFEEPLDKYLLTCFLLQGDQSTKAFPVDSLVLTFDLFPEAAEPRPFDFFAQFYPLSLSQYIGTQDVGMLSIVLEGSASDSRQKFLILRVGGSLYDIFQQDHRQITIKNDLVQNTLHLLAYSPYHAVPNDLKVIPKYNIKQLIFIFSVAFGVVLLVLFLCHFKFIKDCVLNKYRRFKVVEEEILHKEDLEDVQEAEIETETNPDNLSEGLLQPSKSDSIMQMH